MLWKYFSFKVWWLSSLDIKVAMRNFNEVNMNKPQTDKSMIIHMQNNGDSHLQIQYNSSLQIKFLNSTWGTPLLCWIGLCIYAKTTWLKLLWVMVTAVSGFIDRWLKKSKTLSTPSQSIKLQRCHTVKTFGLLQPYSGHLSCMPVVYVTCYKLQRMLLVWFKA